MKRLTVCIAIICFMIVIAIVALYNMQWSTKMIVSNVSQIIYSVNEGDTERAITLADETTGLWEHYTSIAYIYLEQDQLTRITISISKLKTLIQTNNDNLLSECESTIKLVEDLYRSQLPLLNNIL